MLGTASLSIPQLDTLNRSLREMGDWQVVTVNITNAPDDPGSIRVAFHIAGADSIYFGIKRDGRRVTVQGVGGGVTVAERRVGKTR